MHMYWQTSLVVSKKDDRFFFFVVVVVNDVCDVRVVNLGLPGAYWLAHYSVHDMQQHMYSRETICSHKSTLQLTSNIYVHCVYYMARDHMITTGLWPLDMGYIHALHGQGSHDHHRARALAIGYGIHTHVSSFMDCHTIWYKLHMCKCTCTCAFTFTCILFLPASNEWQKSPHNAIHQHCTNNYYHYRNVNSSPDTLSCTLQ